MTCWTHIPTAPSTCTMASCTRATPTLRNSPCRVGPESILDTANLLGISVARDNSVARLRATLPHAGYGQGDVVATPLRMARVAAAIASNGILRDTNGRT